MFDIHKAGFVSSRLDPRRAADISAFPVSNPLTGVFLPSQSRHAASQRHARASGGAERFGALRRVGAPQCGQFCRTNWLRRFRIWIPYSAARGRKSEGSRLHAGPDGRSDEQAKRQGVPVLSTWESPLRRTRSVALPTLPVRENPFSCAGAISSS